MILSAGKSRLSDVELLEQFVAGSSEAFGRLLCRYEKSLYAFLVRYTGDMVLAEDIFQNTFLQVYQSAGLFDHGKSFKPWLYTIALNKARDALRQKKRQKAASIDAVSIGDDSDIDRSFADIIPSKILSPDEISVNRELRGVVQELIGQLPENLRAVLVMSYFDRLPQKEIAEVLNVPVGTVKSRLHKAMAMFGQKWNAWAKKQNMNGDAELPK
ncbi:MAG TPA: sigma-70 family RNA polymerase sigma factor [Phycisphaerae bacterium]|nr:sigma-70 family RNA polymerase sigma factor [Phycisphaerae bacterium]HPS52490.1 sigma-70 family RNA polymerase sigma factor [Phycisphaerae bacterium]